MNQTKTTIKRALISVSDKTGIVELARTLIAQNIEIISTGGTSKLLRAANIPTKDVSDMTQFPEMMDGRIKTLHPKIHGGILGLRDEHEAIAKQHHIDWIDLVIVNLYPFATTIKKPDTTFDTAIENIDIGGPTMIRAAAKNMGWVGIVVDPADYATIAEEITHDNSLCFSTRKRLATKAFTHTAHYDAIIANYLNPHSFPEQINLSFQKHADLRYGENPHQAASAYKIEANSCGVLSATQHQGKQLSYNNIADSDAALNCVCEFTQPACVIVKHANPCGVSLADDIYTAYQKAYAADPTSAFGGIVALNRTCDKDTAQALTALFLEVIIAPAYTPDALALLASKPNLRVLELPLSRSSSAQEYKFIEGGLLIQDKDSDTLDQTNLRVVTTTQPEQQQIETMLFAWRALKHIKSNAILLAKNNTTLGIGAGQVSRIDSVEIALRKSGNNLSNAILASDAFFPFRDSIDRIAASGEICAIIQPGGSIKDEEVIQACNEHSIAMVFTGKRCFKH